MAYRLSKAFGSTPETWLGMQMAFDLAETKRATDVQVKLNGDVLEVNQHIADNRVFISLIQTTTVNANQLLEIEITT